MKFSLQDFLIQNILLSEILFYLLQKHILRKLNNDWCKKKKLSYFTNKTRYKYYVVPHIFFYLILKTIISDIINTWEKNCFIYHVLIYVKFKFYSTKLYFSDSAFDFSLSLFLSQIANTCLSQARKMYINMT